MVVILEMERLSLARLLSLVLYLWTRTGAYSKLEDLKGASLR
jgi:hypothetical protein